MILAQASPASAPPCEDAPAMSITIGRQAAVHHSSSQRLLEMGKMGKPAAANIFVDTTELTN
jgi:hypothetical protein